MIGTLLSYSLAISGNRRHAWHHIRMCLFCLRCYGDSIRSYFTHLCFKNLLLCLSLCLCVVAQSVVNMQHSTCCLVQLVVCFPVI